MKVDVVVVGGGNAGLCAALAVRERRQTVLVLDRGPRETSGGNTRFAGGGYRVVVENESQARELVPDLTANEAEQFLYYSMNDFFNDWARVTKYRADPDQVELIIKGSLETLVWMRQQGVPFLPWHEWHGIPVGVSGGGDGIVESLTRAAERSGVQIQYESRAIDLRKHAGSIAGVVVERAGELQEIEAGAVVLAAGGFQASPEWRSRHLGPGWDLARVRGTWANTGDAIRMAIDQGAQSYGHWSCAHATPWELYSPTFGDPRVGDMFKKHSYHLGIMVNAEGERFVDESSDFKSYTYARLGGVILAQPGGFGWQVFDGKVLDLLGEEYRLPRTTKVRAGSLDELVQGMTGVDPDGFASTVAEYNGAVDTSRPFDPGVLDGRGAPGLLVPRMNWANRIDTPPYEAYAVTCGVTFTFGGVRINEHAEVLDFRDVAIPGLYAAGEMVGGNFYYNYPGGTGLTAGAVLGRIAGHGAATHVGSQQG